MPLAYLASKSIATVDKANRDRFIAAKGITTTKMNDEAAPLSNHSSAVLFRVADG